MYAQDIIVDATTSQVTIFSGGKLNLRGATSKFRSSSADTTFFKNTGQIHFKGTDNTFSDFAGTGNVGSLGSTPALRVPGVIYYSKSSTGPQNIQARWYASLTMDSAAPKTIPTLVYIGSTYNVTANAGNRAYTGDFVYDGILAQPIFGENGSGPTSNAYANLVFQNAGVKTLATAQTANADNFTTDASATGGVVINGTMSIDVATTLATASPLTITDGTFNTGTGAGDLSGNVTISGAAAAAGKLVTNGAGLVTISGTTTVNSGGTLDILNGNVTVATSGTLALGNFATAALSVGASRTMTVTGTFTNAHTESVNMTFFDDGTANTTNSTVIYNGTGTQSIVGTVEANPYSNLTSSGSAKTAPNLGIVLAGNFDLNGGNLDMAAANAGNGAVLRMTDDATTAQYNGSAFEVVGKMRRDIGSSTAALTFNNDSTRLAITNPGNVEYFTLDVTPNYAATGNWDYNPDTDIRRRINYDYQATGTDWAAELTYGFKETDAPTGKFNDAAFLNTLRMREILTNTTSEKVSTGVQPKRNNGSGTPNFRAITLAAIRGTGGAVPPQSILAEVADNAGLFLRGGPAMFISVRAGRWSNPATWDEGEQPGAEDRAAIRHNVHIGFTSTVDNFGIDENVAIAAKGSPTYTNKSTLAAEILINDQSGQTLASNLATLIVGATTNVGITTFDSSNPLATLIPNHGSILVSPFTGTAGSLTETLMNSFKADYALITTSTATFNLGLVIVPTSILTIPKNLDAKGLVNNGGELNVGE